MYLKDLRQEFFLTMTDDKEYGDVSPQLCVQQYNYNVKI